MAALEGQAGDHRQPVGAEAPVGVVAGGDRAEVRIGGEGVDPDGDHRVEVGAQRLAEPDRLHDR